MAGRITFSDRVLKVERKSRIKRGWKDKNDVSQFDYQDLGWFVQLASSRESFTVGSEEPKDIKPGMPVKVTIEY